MHGFGSWETYEEHVNAALIKRCSAVFFFAGRADWSPWETETVEPAFGPYHFTDGTSASGQTSN